MEARSTKEVVDGKRSPSGSLPGWGLQADLDDRDSVATSEQAAPRCLEFFIWRSARARQILRSYFLDVELAARSRMVRMTSSSAGGSPLIQPNGLIRATTKERR